MNVADFYVAAAALWTITNVALTPARPQRQPRPARVHVEQMPQRPAPPPPAPGEPWQLNFEAVRADDH